MTATQFFGAFNDNLFKQLMLLLAIPVGAAAARKADEQGLATMLFSLPFVLFSGFAGYLSDRYSKRTMIVCCKVAEIGIMKGRAGTDVGCVQRTLICILQSAFCIAAFGQEPQTLPQNVDARPIEEAAGDPNVLRWQSKPQQTTGWNITRIDPSVKQAQYSDVFNDPFGDRKPKAEPELILQPTQAESNVEELPPPRRFSSVRRAAPSDEPTMLRTVAMSSAP